MNTRNTTYLFLATLITGSAHAALLVNTGATGAPAGQGPQGANGDYLAYTTVHEDNDGGTTGQVTIYNGISFAEGGLGTANVGVGFTWLDATARQSKQAFDNRSNPDGYPDLWDSWIGIDSRTSNGGINGADRFQLNLSGLPVNQNFTFTSYHGDTDNQGGTFTVDQTPSSTEASTSPFAFPNLNASSTTEPWTDFAYSFDVASDGSGNLDITFTRVPNSSQIWIGINGFDLVAVPEPSTGLLALVASSALLLRRRRA